jgi:Histidyl-tRNA synthetase
LEKIHSLTGMIDLIGHKTSKEDISERIFYAEEILRDIFESYSISEIRTPALESQTYSRDQLEMLQILLIRNYILFLIKMKKV